MYDALVAFTESLPTWAHWLGVMLVSAIPFVESYFGTLIGVLAGVGLPLWILANTNYTLTDMTLHVRCGPFSYKVPIAEISSVTPTRSILSAPALSLDRLRIEYSRGKVVVISPEDRERFLKDLDIRRRRRS